MPKLASITAAIAVGIAALGPNVAKSATLATMTFEPGAGFFEAGGYGGWHEGPGYMIRQGGDDLEDLSGGSFNMGEVPRERALLGAADLLRIYVHSFYLDASAPITLSDLAYNSTPLVIVPDNTPGFEFIDLGSSGPYDGYFGRFGVVAFVSTNSSSFRLDNISYTPAPEPGRWALMILGLLSAGCQLRKMGRGIDDADLARIEPRFRRTR